MFEKLKNLLQKEQKDENIEKQNEQTSGYKPPLDFKKAIEEHDNIKVLLEKSLEFGLTEETKKSTNTNNCFLKEWLDNPKGSSLRKTQIFKDLIQAHNQYHELIEDVIALIESNNQDKAKEIINSKLKISLNKVRSYLMQLKLLHEKNYELKQILID